MTVIAEDRFTGALLGLALGDALGARFEGGPIERSLWRVIGRTRSGKMRWTDDTQMSLDLADSLVANGTLDVDDAAQRFAKSYHWSRGYGPGAAKLLKRIHRGVRWQEAVRSVFPDGSFGNGGAMRVPVIGLFFAADPDGLVDAARASAGVTHAHPLGIEGAVLVATATREAALGSDPNAILASTAEHATDAAFRDRIERAREWLATSAAPSPREVSTRLGSGIRATESCVTAVYLGARFKQSSFLDLHHFVAACGGDADTIGSMSGAIWGAANGEARLPDDLVKRLEAATRIRDVAVSLHRVAKPVC